MKITLASDQKYNYIILTLNTKFTRSIMQFQTLAQEVFHFTSFKVLKSFITYFIYLLPFDFTDDRSPLAYMQVQVSRELQQIIWGKNVIFHRTSNTNFSTLFQITSARIEFGIFVKNTLLNNNYLEKITLFETFKVSFVLAIT